ncbi:MAG: hypothetical protein WAK63_12150 [Xanthobacteraceae bacterium]
MLCAAAGFACDRILFHGTTGGAFSSLQASSGALRFSGTTQTGWTAGGGVEAAIDGFANCGAPTNVPLIENVVRAGINYKFSW